MAGFSVSNNEHLVRSQLWSSQLKEIFEEELIAMNYVDMITDFPDGDTLNIPSIGQHEVQDYVEGQPIKYNAMDTGNFTFQITEYKSAATYITRKMLQDSFYASRLQSSFVPKQARALAVAMETDFFIKANAGQTADDQNLINEAEHRFVATGTNDVISLEDFARAKYALRKSNVPMSGLVAIVDPSVEYTLSTLTNLTNVSNNPKWEGIVRDGMSSTGLRFAMNVYGFDVWVSDYLVSGLGETIDSNSVTNGVANIFFSTAPEAVPVVGAIRQMPTVDSEFNKDLQREEYVTTARWGLKMKHPENFVTVISDTSAALA